MNQSSTPTRRPLVAGAALAVTAVLLAACGASSPSPTQGASQEPSAPASVPASVAESVPASVVEPAARCAETPEATPATSVEIAQFSFGDDITVDAGSAVAFGNEDTVGHTVTEGTDGQAAQDACVNKGLSGGGIVVVTFTEVGDYQITCRIHRTMQMVVHVQ
ncbi:MAG TPA: plastocyanin/azurin family copper-binding protein [Candidatus Limnocylindria bacterium]|nr:plastocyanin/azurin family copper-binding protein [Candidatus Limnocylindria bacterium]